MLQLLSSKHSNKVSDTVKSSFSYLINQLSVGKCPNDCSNHGQCDNGTCICVSTWTGGDCSKGMVTVIPLGGTLTGILQVVVTAVLSIADALTAFAIATLAILVLNV